MKKVYEGLVVELFLDEPIPSGTALFWDSLRGHMIGIRITIDGERLKIPDVEQKKVSE